FVHLYCIDMRILGKKKLQKIKKKNIGNRKLCKEIDKLLMDLEAFDPQNEDIKVIRKDADLVHGDGFYFFNIHIHRTLILLELDDEGEATIVWAGNHKKYEETFKNQKSVIEKWLRNKNYI